MVQTPRTLKLFAEYYRLNIDDLITLNHFSDESEMLYAGQEIFINVTEQRAYDIGLLEKAQPILPKDEVPIKKTSTKKTTKTSSPTSNTSTVSSTGGGNITPNSTASSNKDRKQRYFNKKISNGFAAGYCTWYAAHISPWMFDENGQRLFGGNAKDWYVNAQSEKAKAAGIKVSKTNPGAGAIVVYNPLRSYAGHVAVVKAYYPESGEMLVEDMNYVGKYIVTQRWDNVSNAKIIGYIYK
ncbi:MAG: CHAP domain-containing protein [bacterium]|nr:CHAP domain-containing protein [bacterium]